MNCGTEGSLAEKRGITKLKYSKALLAEALLPHLLPNDLLVLRPLTPDPARLTCSPLTIAFGRMIHVTDNAVNHLRLLLAEQPVPDGKGLRVQVAKGGCSGLQYEMSLDNRREGDAVVERAEVQFLIDAESVDFLRNATLDFEDGLTGSGFRIVNPNAARTCGCGTSFEPVRPA